MSAGKVAYFDARRRGRFLAWSSLDPSSRLPLWSASRLEFFSARFAVIAFARYERWRTGPSFSSTCRSTSRHKSMSFAGVRIAGVGSTGGRHPSGFERVAPILVIRPEIRVSIGPESRSQMGCPKSGTAASSFSRHLIRAQIRVPPGKLRLA
jgi:hypothetical protein